MPRRLVLSALFARLVMLYGLLVFAMEFLPFGAVNPPEVAEYFTMVGVLQH
jgi:hypothetical protein